jgi:hypothetical protein
VYVSIGVNEAYHAKDPPLVVDFPVVEADYSFYVLKLVEEVDFALVAADSGFVGVFELHALEGEELEVLGHDAVHG